MICKCSHTTPHRSRRHSPVWLIGRATHPDGSLLHIEDTLLPGRLGRTSTFDRRSLLVIGRERMLHFRHELVERVHAAPGDEIRRRAGRDNGTEGAGSGN